MGAVRPVRVDRAAELGAGTWAAALGRYEEAEDLLPDICEMAAGLGHELDQARVLWLSGRVAAGRGRGGDARTAFDQARRRFAAHRDGYDAALVTLDLAVLELEEGRTSEVRALAEEMVWILGSHGLCREAIALGLFCRAAAAEQATPELARQVMASLERARRVPQPDSRRVWDKGG